MQLAHSVPQTDFTRDIGVCSGVACRLPSGRRRPTGADGGVRPEMGLHSGCTPVKRDPGCSFGMDLGWDALRDGV